MEGTWQGSGLNTEGTTKHRYEKHEMKEVIGLQFLFSHPSAFRDFRVLAYPAVAVHPLRRGSTSQCFDFTILVNTPDLLSGFHCKIWVKSALPYQSPPD